MKNEYTRHVGNHFSDEARESVAVFALRVASLVMGIAATVLLARILGPDKFGLYSLVLAAATLAALPAHAGLGTLVLRITSAEYVKGAYSLVLGMWRWTIRAQATISVAVMGIAALALWLVSGQLTSDEVHATIFGILLTPVLALSATRIAMMRGLGDPVAGVMLEALLQPALLLVGLVMLWLVSRLEPVSALALYLGTVLVTFVFGYFLVLWRSPKEIFQATPEYQAGEWWRAVFPLALLVGIERLIKYTDILLLGALGTAADVGLYRVAVQGADVIVFALAVIMLVFGPRLARLHAQGDTASLQKLVTQGSRWSMVAAGLSFLVLLIAGEWLLTVVFGVRYTESIQPLLILAAGQLVVAWFGVTLTVLKMTGNERSSAVILGAAAVGNVALNYILIPPLGPTGAAIATALTLGVSRVALSRIVQKRLGVYAGVLGSRFRGNAG